MSIFKKIIYIARKTCPYLPAPSYLPIIKSFNFISFEILLSDDVVVTVWSKSLIYLVIGCSVYKL
jgi:hypothetical protein